MSQKEQIERIIQKLDLLKSLDQNFEIFGSENHRYLLNKPKPESEILEFEKVNKIKLPGGYREFLRYVGNGGAGPYYGLEPLENGRYADLDYKNADDLINLSLPFPHSEHWNLDFGEINEENEKEYFRIKDEVYFDNKWANGLLRISNFGCGVSMNLVANGNEYGNIWVDDRCNDQGIYPDPYFEVTERLAFLDWYEIWLDKSIKEKR